MKPVERQGYEACGQPTARLRKRHRPAALTTPRRQGFTDGAVYAESLWPDAPNRQTACLFHGLHRGADASAGAVPCLSTAQSGT